MKTLEEMKKAKQTKAMERYHYVRSFGYDSVEAGIMMNWGTKRIEAQLATDGKTATLESTPGGLGTTYHVQKTAIDVTNERSI